MEYARLGSAGMQGSRICLGCMGFGDAARWIHKWVLDEENSRQPVTAPIIGATKISHLEDAAGALSVKLSPEDVTYLEEPYVPHSVVGPV